MVCWSGAVSLKLREKWLQTYSHTVLLPKPVKFDVLSSFGDFTFFQLVFGFKLHGMSQKSLFYSFKFIRSNNLENCVHNYLKRPDFIQKLKPKTFKETSKNKKFNPNKSDLHLLKKYLSIFIHWKHVKLPINKTVWNWMYSITEETFQMYWNSNKTKHEINKMKFHFQVNHKSIQQFFILL